MNIQFGYAPVDGIVRKVATTFTSERAKDIAMQEASLKGQRSAKASASSLIPYVRTAAIIETVIFLTIVVMLNGIFGDGTRFINLAVHPFWVIVLLITVQYGPAEALMAAGLSSAFLLIGNLPEQSLTETMYEYIMHVSFSPFLWFMAALVLGGVRARQLNERKHMFEDLSKAENAAAAITDNYKSVKQSKEQLELRLAEERCSVLSIYEIAKSLETLDRDEARVSLEKLVRVALNPKKFSLFLSDGASLGLKTSYGWDESDTYAKKFGADTPFIQHAYKTGRTLSIFRQDEEELLNGEGMLVGLFVDEQSKKIFGMLKIEKIGFTDMSIRTHEIFRIICAWIANVYINIDKYEAAVSKKRMAALVPDKATSRTRKAGLKDKESRESAA